MFFKFSLPTCNFYGTQFSNLPILYKFNISMFWYFDELLILTYCILNSRIFKKLKLSLVEIQFKVPISFIIANNSIVFCTGISKSQYIYLTDIDRFSFIYGTCTKNSFMKTSIRLLKNSFIWHVLGKSYVTWILSLIKGKLII